MKYNIIDCVNIFLFIIVIILIINKINKIETFNLCGSNCNHDHECEIDFKCKKKKCCKLD